MANLLVLLLLPLLLVPFALPVVFFLIVRARVERLERAQQAWRRRVRSELDAVTERLERLESGVAAVESEAHSAETTASAAAPASSDTSESAGSRGRPEAPPAVGHPPSSLPPLSAPKGPAPPVAVRAAPVPSPPRGPRDLESVIGAGWLNRIGVLVLVIGLALTVGYAVTATGPAGRVMIGYLTALAMMAGGLAAERRAPYRHYGYGLIGGAWAAAYFTTYAMHWLQASRLVSSPLAGILLLFAVSGGMIAHSLRYRSELVTGMAFVVGFATLAVSPVSRFSLIALVPLALALLVVSGRERWVRLPVLGAAVTYLVYLFSEGSLPEATSRMTVFLLGQSVLTVYWAVFESFDLMRRRAGAADEPDSLWSLLSPVNALGFAAASILQWMSLAPEILGHFFALAALLFGAVAVARALVPSPPSADPAQRTIDSFRGPLTLAAAMAALALGERYAGYPLTVALLFEAQALLVLAMWLRDRYVRALAGIAFVLAMLKLVSFDLWTNFTATWLGLQDWSVMALASVAVLYADRVWLARRGGVHWSIERLYSWVATGLLWLVVLIEMPERAVQITWFGLGVGLFEIGLRSARQELRAQAYVAFLSAFVVAWWRIGPTDAFERLDLWVIAAPLTLGAWLLGLRLRRVAAADEPDCRVAATATWVAGSILLLTLLWRLLPPAWVAPAWTVFWLCSLLWDRGGAPLFRIGRHGLVLLVWVRCWSLYLRSGSEIELFALMALALVALGLYAGRTVQHRRYADSTRVDVESELPWLPAVAATLLVIATLYRAVDGSLLTVAFGVHGALLLGMGFATADRLQRMSGLAVLGICLVKAFAYDLGQLAPLFRILSFVVLGLVLLGVSLLYTRSRARAQRNL